MRYTFDNGTAAVYDYDFFKPDATFDCGQCFRFVRSETGAWSGVVGHSVFSVSEGDGALKIKCKDIDTLTSVVLPFLNIGQDYSSVRSDISAHFAGDETMRHAMEYGRGIRILRQDPWEALSSFILSQNNNIPRIKGLIKTICERFGEELQEGVYSFPTPEALASAGADALAECRMGFRAPYLFDAACRVCDGSTDLESIAAMPTLQGAEELKRIKGVGDKVAACTLLFGMGKTDSFPIDVWMKKIINEYYGGSLDPASLGKYAGIAQQYLFYYIRSLG